LKWPVASKEGKMRPQTDQEIIDLVRRLETAPKLVSERMGQARDQVYDLVKVYMSDKLAGSFGQITPEILATADRLYDLHGLPRAMSEALHLEGRELSKLLGRKITLTCRDCGREFEVFARRVRDGYSETHSHCDDCRNDKREDYEATAEREFAEAKLKVSIDSQLALASDPLEIPQFREHLQSFIGVWLNRSAPRPLTNANQNQVQGCFVCGANKVRFGLTRERSLNDFGRLTAYVSKWLNPPYKWSRFEKRLKWVGVSVLAQALWRIDASDYFDHFARLPILAMPVQILCRYCWDTNDAGIQYRELQEGAEWSLTVTNT
jgi:hypothetical protein